MGVLKDIDEMEILTVRDLINSRTDFNITADYTEMVFAQRKTTKEIYRVDIENEYDLLLAILYELGINYEYKDKNILKTICEYYDY